MECNGNRKRAGKFLRRRWNHPVMQSVQQYGPHNRRPEFRFICGNRSRHYRSHSPGIISRCRWRLPLGWHLIQRKGSFFRDVLHPLQDQRPDIDCLCVENLVLTLLMGIGHQSTSCPILILTDNKTRAKRATAALSGTYLIDCLISRYKRYLTKLRRALQTEGLTAWCP